MSTSRTTTVALALLALVAVTHASSELSIDGARAARQLRFTCPDVKALAGNCGALCTCLRQQAPNDPNAAKCESLCESCVAAAKGCVNTPGAPLPAQCASYQSAVTACTGRRRSAL